MPQEPPAAGQPLARTADPRPLLARVEETVGRYRQTVEELAAGRLDGEEFHGRTQGMRVGIVVDGEAVWLYEAEHERWVYCDGNRLSTYATPKPVEDGPGPHDEAGPEPPAAARPEPPASGDPEPTQVVPGDPEPTQVVPGIGPEPTKVGGNTGPEPTRVVGDTGPEPPEPGEDRGHAPTRFVTGDGDG